MDTNKATGLFTARVILGLIFFMQGYGKVFKIGIDNVYNGFFRETYQDLLPSFLTIATAYYTSLIELICGFLLVVGLKRNIAYYLLATVLIIVSFGHGLAEPIWDLSHVMYRTILLVFLLVIPQDQDIFSLDHLLFKRPK